VTIQERFEKYDAENPQIFALFARFARELYDAGIRRYSAEGIIQRIRWHYDVNVRKDQYRKINDHFRSRFARKLMNLEPWAKGFFELRRLRSA
jgi:hypothetical protein